MENRQTIMAKLNKIESILNLRINRPEVKELGEYLKSSLYNYYAAESISVLDCSKDNINRYFKALKNFYKESDLMVFVKQDFKNLKALIKEFIKTCDNFHMQNKSNLEE